MQNITPFLDLSPFLLILLGAVFVHACFQLSVSVLTLLSSHTIGRRLPNARILNLNFWYILGVASMIATLLVGAIALHRWALSVDPHLATTVTVGVIPFIAILTVLFYYRRGRGTQLWLPRPAAEYITGRAKKTTSSVEAFALGMSTAVAELPFAIAPLAIVALAFQNFAVEYWFHLATAYAFVVVMPLIFVAFYISSGHKLSSVQRWREESKDYLKWTSAGALLLLTIYLLVLQIGVGL